MKKKLPDPVLQIIHSLQNAGFSAYLVGGAVRDLLLGRTPDDFDITTSAKPEEVLQICRKHDWKTIEKLGKNFGVVAVVLAGKVWEVATFRGESYGEDAHRPTEVWFETSLAADLSRRDFTMNAMAMTETGTVIDFFGGQRDLAAKLIRTVGNPTQRFAEDALRMFRACRFAAQLGFYLDPSISLAIPGLLERVAGLSVERVRAELNRLLVSRYPAFGLKAFVNFGLADVGCSIQENGCRRQILILPELRHLVGAAQNPAFHAYDVWRHTLHTVTAVPPDLLLRWAALLHDVAKAVPGIRAVSPDGRITDYGHDQAGAKYAGAILTRLKFSPKFTARVKWLISRHMQFYVHFYQVRSHPDGVRHWIRRVARSGEFRTNEELSEAFFQLSALCFADAKATGRSQVNEIEQQRLLKEFLALVGAMPVHTADLALSGSEVRPLVANSTQIGPCLKVLLGRVQDGTLANDKKDLAAAAHKWIERQEKRSELAEK